MVAVEYIRTLEYKQTLTFMAFIIVLAFGTWQTACLDNNTSLGQLFCWADTVSSYIKMITQK